MSHIPPQDRRDVVNQHLASGVHGYRRRVECHVLAHRHQDGVRVDASVKQGGLQGCVQIEALLVAYEEGQAAQRAVGVRGSIDEPDAGPGHGEFGAEGEHGFGGRRGRACELDNAPTGQATRLRQYAVGVPGPTASQHDVARGPDRLGKTPISGLLLGEHHVEDDSARAIVHEVLYKRRVLVPRPRPWGVLEALVSNDHGGDGARRRRALACTEPEVNGAVLEPPDRLWLQVPETPHSHSNGDAGTERPPAAIGVHERCTGTPQHDHRLRTPTLPWAGARSLRRGLRRLLWLSRGRTCCRHIALGLLLRCPAGLGLCERRPAPGTEAVVGARYRSAVRAAGKGGATARAEGARRGHDSTTLRALPRGALLRSASLGLELLQRRLELCHLRLCVLHLRPSFSHCSVRKFPSLLHFERTAPCGPRVGVHSFLQLADLPAKPQDLGLARRSRTNGLGALVDLVPDAIQKAHRHCPLRLCMPIAGVHTRMPVVTGAHPVLFGLLWWCLLSARQCIL